MLAQVVCLVWQAVVDVQEACKERFVRKADESHLDAGVMCR